MIGPSQEDLPGFPKGFPWGSPRGPKHTMICSMLGTYGPQGTFRGKSQHYVCFYSHWTITEPCALPSGWRPPPCRPLTEPCATPSGWRSPPCIFFYRPCWWPSPRRASSSTPPASMMACHHHPKMNPYRCRRRVVVVRNVVVVVGRVPRGRRS